MMATTHGFMGGILALPMFLFSPELSVIAFVASFVGGVFPDLDLYYGHRRVLHYPVYYSILCLVIFPLFFVYMNFFTVSIWFFVAGAALHCLSDRFGGSKDSRPWENDSGKAVYSHYHGEWWAPRKWIRYDGSPEDFLIMFVASIPAFYVLEGELRVLTGLMVVISFFYTLLRKKGMDMMPDILLRS